MPSWSKSEESKMAKQRGILDFRFKGRVSTLAFEAILFTIYNSSYFYPKKKR